MTEKHIWQVGKGLFVELTSPEPLTFRHWCRIEKYVALAQDATPEIRPSKPVAPAPQLGPLEGPELPEHLDDESDSGDDASD
jgi:hypothetical protein